MIVGVRWLVLASALALAALAAHGAARVAFDASIEVWFLEDDEALVRYREFLQRFSADDVIVMAALASDGGDVFRAPVLERIAALDEAMSSVPDVVRVRSLATISIPYGSGEDVAVGSMLEVATSSTAMTQKVALSSRFVRGVFCSNDGRAAAIVVYVSPSANSDVERKRALIRRLREIASAEPAVRTLAGGGPVMDVAFFDYSERDVVVLGPVSILVALTLVFLSFRRASAALVPVAIVMLSLVYTFGLMGALAIRITPISASLGSLVLAIGVAESLHLVAEHRHVELGPKGSAARALADLVTPLVFTSATTVAGLLSLLIAELRPVREFAELSALAVVVSFFVSVTVGPALLSFIRPMEPPRTGTWTSSLLSRLGRPTVSGSRRVLMGSALTCLLGLWALSHLEVGSNPIAYFRDSEPMRRATEEIDRTLGGSTTVELFVSGDHEALRDPATLARLAALERSLESTTRLPSVVSYVDLVEDLYFRLTGRAGMPATKDEVSQLLLLAEQGEGLDELLVDDGDRSFARMTARIPLSDAKRLIEQIPLLDARLRSEFGTDELRVVATGMAKLMADMEVYLLDGQRNSFLLAFAQIGLLMALLLRSVRMGLFAMIPNLVPVWLGLSTMALFRVPLDPGTMMVASVVLGIVVDDTVHFLVRFTRLRRSGESLERALEETLVLGGRAVLATSLVLAAGFAVLAFGSFLPNVRFGLVSAATILLALVSELVILPAALVVLRPGAGVR
ncbi:MAG: MMPL family transporter [Deltaproteobacteria bacterium]|nr:MMPL family transporter [Deltaproteobacteria bacterium]